MKSLSVSQWIWLVLAYVLLNAVAGMASAADLVGNGEWQSLLGDAMRGTWTATLSRSGTEVEGSITLTGSPLLAEGDVTGTIEGDEILLGVLAEGEHRATFKGTLVDDRISGEWDFPAISDHGNWSGTLQSEENQ